MNSTSSTESPTPPPSQDEVRPPSENRPLDDKIEPSGFTTLPPRDGKVYRFGICGGPNSGKTCLLTGLAMLHSAHALGYAATLLPPSEAEKAKRIRTADGKEVLTPRERGWEWIVKAKNQILARSVPTANWIDSNRMLLRFHFVKRDGTELAIELIDYSGELMVADGAGGGLASKLRQDLNEMDGLLVVAAHPLPEHPAKQLAPELNSFIGAFSLLRDEAASKVPIALLINMWDRAGTLPDLTAHERDLGVLEHDKKNIPEADYRARYRQLELKYRKLLSEMSDAFLSGQPPQDGKPFTPAPPHASIRDVLRGAAGDELFASFPVSAFGPSELVMVKDEKSGKESLIERPQRVDILDSFGVEDPFFWLVEKRDAMDVGALETKANPFRLPFSPSTLDQCKREAKRLAVRISPVAPDAQRVQDVRRRLTQVQIIQSVSFVLMLLAVILGIEASLDARGHRLARAGFEGRNANGAEEGTAWYEAYLEAKDYRHLGYRFVFPRGQAEAELKEKREAREGREWVVLSAEKVPAQQLTLLQSFLKRYPNSTRRPEAIKRISDCEREMRIAETREFLASVPLTSLEGRKSVMQKETEYDATPILNEAKKLSDSLDEVRNKVVELKDDALSTEHKRLGDGVQAVKNWAIDAGADMVVRKEYRIFMDKGDILGAGRLLTRSAQRPSLQDLRRDYRDNMLGKLADRVKKDTYAREIGKCRNLRTMLDELSRTPAIIGGGNDSLVPGDAAIQTLRNLKMVAANALEELTYAGLRDMAKPEELIPGLRSFLAEFPNSAMTAAITLKLAHLEMADQERFYSIVPVEIRFSQNALKAGWGNKLQGLVDFKLNDNPFKENFQGLSSDARLFPGNVWVAGRDSSLSAVTIKTRALADTVRITAKLKHDTYDLGSKGANTRLTEWKDGRFEMTVGDGVIYGGSTIVFKVEYFDKAGNTALFANPVLPSWTAAP